MTKPIHRKIPESERLETLFRRLAGQARVGDFSRVESMLRAAGWVRAEQSATAQLRKD